MSDTLEMIAYNIIEIIMHDPFSDMEAECIITELDRLGMDSTVNQSGRILTVDVMDADEDMRTILEVVGSLGCTEDIGLIKIMTQLEPQWERETHDILH